MENSGCGCLLAIIGIVLVGLKLLGVLNISWVWVLCPFWIPTAIIIGIWILAALGIIAAFPFLLILKK